MTGEPRLEYLALESILGAPRNPKEHDLGAIHQSLDRFGFVEVPVRNETTGRLVAGHGRIDALRQRKAAGTPPPRGIKVEGGRWLVPVLVGLGFESEREAEAYLIASNRLPILGGWNDEGLRAVLSDLAAAQALEGTGYDSADIDAMLANVAGAGGPGGGPGGPSRAQARKTLAERFLVPPFSVFDARQGYWQDRKRAWLALGIDSEAGRAMTAGGRNTTGKNSAINRLTGRTAREIDDATPFVSVFDPVLAEVAYSWFCPKGGSILDPFAGGSVRGIVAAKLGRRYVGVDLSAQQVEANERQAREILEPEDAAAEYLAGDSAIVLPTIAERFDFVFSCPPYGALEVYSDDPRDVSYIAAKDPEAFEGVYMTIVERALALLKEDRFACFVVGDYRQPEGHLSDFVSLTIHAFETAGARLWNEGILLEALASKPLRAAMMFSPTRKLCKAHQNVLVFVKGDARRATEACGEVEVYVPEPPPEEA